MQAGNTSGFGKVANGQKQFGLYDKAMIHEEWYRKSCAVRGLMRWGFDRCASSSSRFHGIEGATLQRG